MTGTMTAGERAALLAVVRASDVVLEIGCYHGETTVELARKARVVHTVDCFEDLSNDGLQPSLYRFLVAVEPLDNVILHYGRSEVILPTLREDSFDVIFVDGGHKYEFVSVDLDHALDLVKPGGVVAMHDLHLSDVARAARGELEREPDVRVERLGVWRIG